MASPVDANVRVEILDGDTADITYWDGRTERARVPSLNTLESGEKGADWATNRARKLFAGGYGRAYAREFDSKAVDGRRYRRRLFYPVTPTGPWRSLAVTLCAEGWAFPFSNADEPDDNKACFAGARAAAAIRKGIWNPEAFGEGPAAHLSLEVMINPSGSDVRGEYVRITNRGSRSVPLRGWRVRSFGPDGPLPKQRGYGFPDRAHIHPGKTLTLYTHKGEDDFDRNVLYWGTDGHKFTNPNPEINSGDGVVVCDPLDNIRLFQIWGG